MKNSAMNKALKSQSKADIDIWESQYVCGGYKMKKNGKKTFNRAQRRLDKAVIKEQREG